MKSAGVEIKNEQKQVKYKFNGEEIEGRQDVEIDEKVWDIKSASPYSFEKKFGEDGGFNEVVKDDTFGYASQGFLYAESQSKDFGGWIVINKSTGEWTVCETPKLVEPYKSDAIKKAKQESVKVLIVADCGIKAIEQIELANSFGIRVIICDHHKPSTELPKADAILNPKQIDCEYPYKELCGCGIVFKLIQAVNHKKGKTIDELQEFIDLVAIAIAADIVPIDGENRILAYFGLEGEVLMAKGDLTGAIEAFSSGVAIEDQNNYTEPPDWAQPMRHYLGAALLKSNKPEEAEIVYRRDLRWNQNNGWSLFGLYQSLKMQGKASESEEIYKKWTESWKLSDIDIQASHL